MDLRISVVIPVYARQHGAVRAVRSAFSQRGPWIEIIVVDDGSPEPFRLPGDLEADDRIRIVRHPVNQGASAARNSGITAARGNWIAFLDSDDVWLPGKLEGQIAFLLDDQASNPDPMTFYCTGFRQVTAGSGTTIDRLPRGADDPRDLASGCWYSPGSTALVSKVALERIGGLDCELKRLEDLDWALRLSLAGGQLRVAPIIGAVVKVGARPGPTKIDAACRYLIAKWRAEPQVRRLRGLLRRLKAYTDVERAAACHHAGDHLAGMWYLARSLLRAPRTGLHLRQWWPEGVRSLEGAAPGEVPVGPFAAAAH
jgi:glycosyltransferase involved in cell wall biosynthesis